MIHIEEDLDPNSLMDIEDQLNHIDGVSDCHMARNDIHMMAVSYDGAKVSSETLLHQITDKNLHAQLVGF
ncbi:MAG: hypothetical protein OQK78_10265 [Gammaproteobacteria bacterium]|nr:hypothetical protein [Gammaproteobacteria bacterium]